MTPADEPAGLYLHVPFCSAVCPYCDFAVQTGSAEDRARFVGSLTQEIGLWADWTLLIDTVYFGGGTPSLLSPAQLETLLATLQRDLPLQPDARIFLEANPEDVTADRVRAWDDLGIGTVSLGVQSFDDEELRFLGRRHSAAEAATAVSRCLEAGFPTVSVDLIFGLPGQTSASWQQNLNRVVELAPQHVSCYQLTIKDGTNFARRRWQGRLDELGEDQQADLLELTHATLNAAGWQAYEVSNFARSPEHRSLHNLKYWHHAPYLGLGPSAHSFDGRRRWWNERTLCAYSQRIGGGERPVAGSENLDDADLALESLMLGLRTTVGIDLNAFRNRFHVDLLDANRKLVRASVAAGYLRLADGRLRPTVAGLAVADGLATRFSLSRPRVQGL